MTAKTLTLSLTRTLAPAAALFLAGAMLLLLAGHAQSAALHDVAHDLRHANGFPCH